MTDDPVVRAKYIWKESTPLQSFPYLERKKTKNYGVKRYRSYMVVPVRDEHFELTTLQFISESGEKKFLKGGRAGGSFMFLVGLPKETETILIAEGYATGASLRESTEHAVAIALFAANIPKVASVLRAKYPYSRIILCADNDKNGTGFNQAKVAADKVNGYIALPGKETKDFNDLFVAEGSEKVKQAVAEAVYFGKL